MKSFTSVEPTCSKKPIRTRRYLRNMPGSSVPGTTHDELALITLAFARQISESYFLNCWQLFEAETLDMWKTYGNGVAVFSRFDLLKAQLVPMLDNILLGIVRYGEKDMTGYNLMRFLYTKRRIFERERELRVVLQCYDPVGGANRHYNLNNFPKSGAAG